jgi:hypothetical protein
MVSNTIESVSSSQLQVINSFVELRQRAKSVGPKRVAVVVADDEVALTAAEAALDLGIAHPVLIGNLHNIRNKAEHLRLGALLAQSSLLKQRMLSRPPSRWRVKGTWMSCSKDIFEPTS